MAGDMVPGVQEWETETEGACYYTRGEILMMRSRRSDEGISSSERDYIGSVRELYSVCIEIMSDDLP